ncbi:uncharacterized protein TRAVEDRAFT_31719 [Trametes versicolor FP-101664 SS1]|uniref:uncharacterized protein n=1 Tax=Trametes versicolor (strain FP-101664) TaxID=717944 RepID=UPI0004623445|nr:uncharacterized protein TRAVEDRAFT_31719 [Trametes versicolor FP-101664 SS1]EIW53738.1 hypothetical protein TRAVEDRAFT_31719 [Trametes versicolor FP-101664 SS1]
MASVNVVHGLIDAYGRSYAAAILAHSHGVIVPVIAQGCLSVICEGSCSATTFATQEAFGWPDSIEPDISKISQIHDTC